MVSVIEEAAALVHGARQEAYGHPYDDFSRTGRLWGAILGIPDVPPHLVALCMAAVKISREVNAPKRDNLVDLAGYAEALALVRERQADTADTVTDASLPPHPPLVTTTTTDSSSEYPAREGPADFGVHLMDGQSFEMPWTRTLMATVPTSQGVWLRFACDPRYVDEPVTWPSMLRWSNS